MFKMPDVHSSRSSSRSSPFFHQLFDVSPHFAAPTAGHTCICQMQTAPKTECDRQQSLPLGPPFEPLSGAKATPTRPMPPRAALLLVNSLHVGHLRMVAKNKNTKRKAQNENGNEKREGKVPSWGYELLLNTLNWFASNHWEQECPVLAL